MHATGRADLAEDQDWPTTPAGSSINRNRHSDRRLDSDAGQPEALARLEAAEVPAGPIYNVADMVTDPHFLARACSKR